MSIDEACDIVVAAYNGASAAQPPKAPKNSAMIMKPMEIGRRSPAYPLMTGIDPPRYALADFSIGVFSSACVFFRIFAARCHYGREDLITRPEGLHRALTQH